MCNNAVLFCFWCTTSIFFRVVLVFYKKLFLEEVTSKYTTILHIFGTFLHMLREQVSGGSMWNIRVPTVNSMKICQFLGIPLFLGNLNLWNIFFKKNVSAFIVNNTLPNISKSWWYLVIFGCFMLFFPNTTILMNLKMSPYFWLRSNVWINILFISAINVMILIFFMITVSFTKKYRRIWVKLIVLPLSLIVFCYIST